MSLSRGSLSISDVRKGSVSIARIMRGSTQVWAKVAASDDFNRADAETLGASYAYYGGGGAGTRTGIRSGQARAIVSIQQTANSTSINRELYTASKSPTDDCYIQGIVGNRGESGDLLFSHLALGLPGNSYQSGCLVNLRNGGLVITSFSGGTYTDRTGYGGSYAEGDVIRLERRGLTHKVLRNGIDVGLSWTAPANPYPIGADYRNFGIGTSGYRGLAGNIQYSAAWDSWEGGSLAA